MSATGVQMGNADGRGVEGPFLSGVRRGVRDPFGYELVVIPADVSDAVRSAGGWLCDRARAGWKVTVFVDDGADVRALEILGIRSVVVEDRAAALRSTTAASLAVAARAVAQDVQLLKFIDRAIDRRSIEFTLWGDRVPIGLEGRLDRVQSRTSAAAAAFKKHAVDLYGGFAHPEVAAERFHSCGLWYPTNGSDLVPAG